MASSNTAATAPSVRVPSGVGKPDEAPSPSPTSTTRHFPDFFVPQDGDPEEAQLICRDFLRNTDSKAGLGLDIALDAPFTSIDGGITNGLLKVDDRSGKKAYLVRIFGKNTEQLIDREQDNRLVEFLALPTVNVAPTLYCVFGNGRVEEMLNAKALEPHHMHARSPVDLLTAIADAVSKFHLLAPPGTSDECVLWTRLNGFLNQAKEAYPCPEKGRDKFRINWEAIQKELQWLQTVLPSKNNGQGESLLHSSSAHPAVTTAAGAAMFRAAFCHNDLLSGNFLLDRDSPFWKEADAGSGSSAGKNKSSSPGPVPKVHLIDYEYSDTNYVGFDLANHICEHAGFSCNFATLDEGGDFPTRAIRKDVVSIYAAHACERAAARICSGVRGAPKVPLEDRGEDLDACKTVVANASLHDSASPAAIEEAKCHCKEDAMAEEMTNWVEKFCLTSHFWWGLWAFVQSKFSAIDFDFEGYAIKRLKGYALHKEQFLGIKQEEALWQEKK
jgi:thiamine kinase-like enzyme